MACGACVVACEAGALPEIVDISATDARLTFDSSVPLICSVVYGETHRIRRGTVDLPVGGSEGFLQALYLNTFMDAGNVWARPEQFNPTRLFRGAGVGASVLSPLGPLGLDYAYGFDRTDAAGNPNPGWQFHFKLGNFF